MTTFDNLVNVYCFICGRPAEKVEDGTLCGEGHRAKIWSFSGPLGNYTKDGKEPESAPADSWRDRPALL